MSCAVSLCILMHALTLQAEGGGVYNEHTGFCNAPLYTKVRVHPMLHGQQRYTVSVAYKWGRTKQMNEMHFWGTYGTRKFVFMATACCVNNAPHTFQLCKQASPTFPGTCPLMKLVCGTKSAPWKGPYAERVWWEYAYYGAAWCATKIHELSRTKRCCLSPFACTHRSQ